MLQSRRELLTHSQHQHLLPELLTLVLCHTEGPRATVDVARVLPNRLDATFEEVNRVLHLERMNREIVENTPERLEGDDVLHDKGETTFVGAAIAMLIVVESPGVLEWWWAHPTQHC